jgi:hypothetical protein
VTMTYPNPHRLDLSGVVIPKPFGVGRVHASETTIISQSTIISELPSP